MTTTSTPDLIRVTLPDGRILGEWFTPYMDASGHGYVNHAPRAWDDVTDSHDSHGHLVRPTRYMPRTYAAWIDTLVRHYPSTFGH